MGAELKLKQSHRLHSTKPLMNIPTEPLRLQSVTTSRTNAHREQGRRPAGWDSTIPPGGVIIAYVPLARQLRPPLHDVSPGVDQRHHHKVHAAPASPRKRAVPGLVHVVGVCALFQQPLYRGDLVVGSKGMSSSQIGYER